MTDPAILSIELVVGPLLCRLLGDDPRLKLVETSLGTTWIFEGAIGALIVDEDAPLPVDGSVLEMM